MVDAGLGKGCVLFLVVFDFLEFTGFTQKRPRISGGVVQRTSCDIYPSRRRGGAVHGAWASSGQSFDFSNKNTQDDGMDGNVIQLVDVIGGIFWNDRSHSRHADFCIFTSRCFMFFGPCNQRFGNFLSHLSLFLCQCPSFMSNIMLLCCWHLRRESYMNLKVFQGMISNPCRKKRDGVEDIGMLSTKGHPKTVIGVLGRHASLWNLAFLA